MDNPLDFIDFDEVLQHGDPGTWKFLGAKTGSGLVQRQSLDLG